MCSHANQERGSRGNQTRATIPACGLDDSCRGVSPPAVSRRGQSIFLSVKFLNRTVCVDLFLVFSHHCRQTKQNIKTPILCFQKYPVLEGPIFPPRPLSPLQLQTEDTVRGSGLSPLYARPLYVSITLSGEKLSVPGGCPLKTHAGPSPCVPLAVGLRGTLGLTALQ